MLLSALVYKKQGGSFTVMYGGAKKYYATTDSLEYVVINNITEDYKLLKKK